MLYPRKEDQIKNRVVKMCSGYRSGEVQASFEVRFELIAENALKAARATVAAIEEMKEGKND